MTPKYPHALLLIGPTGSGKTPAGNLIAERGIRGQRCFHFDFGALLRRIAETDQLPGALTESDRQIVLDSLQTGRLLENDTFYIAEAILQDFVQRNGITPSDRLVLNGLPRHLGQAADVDRIVRIDLLVYLECSPEVVRERIRLNTGGDRTGRTDDSMEEVSRKLRLFQERTRPLLTYYRERRAELITIPVSTGTTAEQVYSALLRKGLTLA